MKKLGIILGTRPEIIKMAVIISLCEKQGLDYFLVHTGQHYSYNMDKVFFENLELPDPAYNLDIGSGSHGKQTGKMLAGIEQVLVKEEPDVILVEGDTNSVLAGALSAAKLGIKVGHVEAGLRSYDRSMPEELNRILTDHLSDFLFCPTQMAQETVLNEGIKPNSIFVTGNTIVDAVQRNKDLAIEKSSILSSLHLDKENYFLVTAHRQENVDDPQKLGNILLALDQLYEKYSLPLIYPIHPRTKKRIEEYALKKPENVRFIDPLNYLDFLTLQTNARLILTDSGGIQEESCILGIPCVTLRENTERPETIQVKSNMLAGTQIDTIISSVEKMMNVQRNWENPFGDGKSSERILRIINKG